MFEKPKPQKSFYDIEKAILNFWKEKNILDKSINQRPEENTYTFYDGPITANGEPHHGHMLTFAMKDIIPRYWTMKGYRVSRSLGWDCQGIPVEYEVEKRLGFKEKKEIEEYGIAKFNELCRKSVEEYRDGIITLEEMMGRLTNDDEEYATMDKNYIESIWWSLSELYKKGRLYEGFKVVPYSTRAGTTLSNAEVALGGYKKIVDPAITVEFLLENEPDTAVLAWTTTPWTIPSNLGLAVGQDIKYVRVKTVKKDLELELAWLVDNLPEDLEDHKSVEIVQAYIEDYTDDSGMTVKDARARKKGDEYTFTVKYLTDENGNYGSNIEKNKKIKKKAFDRYLSESKRVIKKTRYFYPLSDELTAEIDVHQDHLEGLNIVEVEFQNPYKVNKFEKPEWFGKEVTDSKGIWPYWTSAHSLEEATKLNEEHNQKEFTPESVISPKQYILAKDLVSKVFGDRYYEILEEINADELVGKKYIPPFAFFKGRENTHQIYEGFHVTTEAGTGIVHLAPYGAEDNEIFAEVGIESFDVLDDQGHFTDNIGPYAGMFYKTANKEIINDLTTKDILFDHENYQHDMPMCWRTDTPLIYKPITSWYIGVSKLREELVENNQKINWIPPHVKEGRFGNWLSEIKDWGISRNRYWGTPLPIWKSESGKIKFIGSYAELKELSGVELDDPHRPFVDDITFEIDGEKYTRIPDVLDVWYDSGAMPFARLHYPFENKEKFEKKFPAQYISESVDQTRGWFYSLHAIATTVFDSNAFENVVMSGFVLDDKGAKLSKSKKNYTAPAPLVEQFGADTIRLNFFSTPISSGEDTTVSEKTLKLQKQETLIPLWNIYTYLVTYANLNNWQPREELAYNQRNVTTDEHPWDHIPFDDVNNELDAWILLELQYTIEDVRKYLDNYQIPKATKRIKDFISEISKWYIRSNRDRFTGGDIMAIEVLYYVLIETLKLLAPFAPFISEEIYRKLVVNEMDESVESIHLCDFPEVDSKFIENYKTVSEEMSMVREMVEIGHNLRVENQLKVRQPLNNLYYLNLDSTSVQISEWMRDLVANELNIKNVHENANLKESEFIKVYSTKNDQFKIGLDTEMTEELKMKGAVREITRQIQALRKNNGLKLEDKITIKIETQSKFIKKVLEKFEDEIFTTVSGESIEYMNLSSESKEIKIGGEIVKLDII